MSIMIKQRSNSKNSGFGKLNQLSSGGGSSSTLENEPTSQFQKMKEAIHNLFELAKKELALLYHTSFHQVTLLGVKVKNYKSLSQDFVEQLNEIKKQAEEATSRLPQKLISVLMFPEFIAKALPPSALSLNQYGTVGPKIRNRQPKSSFSLSRNENSSNRIISNIDNLCKKIGPNNIKKIDNLQFLEGEWPNLETISVEGKGLSQVCFFSELKANLLQHINLSNNQIHSLNWFRFANLPFLFELNLSSNKIKELEGIENACFPRLLILNLSKNYIRSVELLQKCSYPQLLELHLEGNRIQKVEPFNQCNFSKLEILNLDNNRISSLSSFAQLPFCSLKVLSFSHNSISLIQFVSKVTLRRLQAFIGHTNSIKSIEPLVKANFPCLRQIVLHKNEIDDISCVKKMNFPKLTGFDLEFNKIQQKSIGCFMTGDKGWREARKKFPFILI